MSSAVPTVRFRILGPIEVAGLGDPSPLRGPRQLALLAFLLVHANRAVSTDQLIDALWSDQAVEGALRRVHVAVNRLRKALDSAGETRNSGPLRTVTGGYLLAVEPGELDADLFRALMHEGQVALDAGRAMEAALALRRGLAMWRGPPLADVAFEEFAQAEIRGLAELRLDAVELAIDADLASGRHREILGEVESLIEEQPLRERPHAQHMLALYRSGRQAEALAAFHELRRTLQAELGIEPGPRVRELHAAILHQDPALDVAPAIVALLPELVVSDGEPQIHARVHALAAEYVRETRTPPVVDLSSAGAIDVAAVSAFADRRGLAAASPAGSARVISLDVARERAGPRDAGSGATTRALPVALRTRRVIVGRDRELGQLERLVRAGGAARVVLITGEAGIGKSALARRAAQSFATGAVLYGRCDDQPLMPFQPFAEAVRDLVERRPELRARLDLAELGRILPELGERAVPVDRERHRLFEAITVAVATAGDSVVLVVDDLHWADSPTLALLRYVIRRARSELVILATARDAGDAGGRLEELAVDLRRTESFERVRLAGLDLQATGELLASRRHAPSDDEVVRDLHAQTNGNPFFIEQLVNAGADPLVPEGITELIARRVAALPEAAAETVRIAAAIGVDFELRDIEPLLGGRETVIAALDAALDAGLIVEAPGVAGRFSFVHAVAREAVYLGMSATRRASLHQRIGEMLAQRRPPAAPALAHHFLAARHVAGPSGAVQWGIVAAQQAASALAWEQEVAHYEAALRALDELESADDEARCRVLLALADRYVPLGRDFRAAARRAAELAAIHSWGDRLAQAAISFARVGEHGIADPEAVRLLERALHALGETDSPWRVRVLSRLVESLATDGRHRERRDALSREGLTVARRVGEPEALFAALGARCAALDGPAATRERIGLLNAALHVAANLHGRSDWLLGCHCELATHHLELGDARPAHGYLEILADTVATNRLHGSYRHAELLQLQARDAIITGRVADAERLAAESRSLGQALGDPDADRIWIAQTIAIQAEHDSTPELLKAVTELATRATAHAPWRAARCLLLTRAGRHNQARAELTALTANECSAIPLRNDWLATLVLLADACAELEDTGTGTTIADIMRPYGDRLALLLYGTAPLGPVSGALGRLASRLGRHDEAVDALERALTTSEAISAPVWAAQARADLRAALRARDTPGNSPPAVVLPSRQVPPGPNELGQPIRGRDPRPDPSCATFVAAYGRRSRLVAPANRTIGRDHEIASVADRLRAGRVRLLTLTGPGGVGKTRLALEAARRVEGDFADGAHVVSLDSVRRSQDVPMTIVATLEIVLLPGESADQAVKRFLANRRELLVIDNCEHVLGAAPFIGELLASCPGVTVLATSREPLALQAEERRPVPPLALPPARGIQNPEALAGVDAVALFCERALTRDPEFELGPGNASAVASICRSLDGLPLAIELAAARCGLLSAVEIAERLDATVGVLGAGARDAPARQLTLWATIDWSHQLLSDDERACFARFAVFAGGATVPAAEAITGASLDTLDLLVAKSLLVRRRQADATTRLVMLETIRAYASERLAATPDHDAVRERHHRYFLTLVERDGSERALWGTGGKEHLARLEADIDNLRSALGWAVAQTTAKPALALAAALGTYWLMRARHAEADYWIDQALSLPGVDAHPALHVRALCSKGTNLWALGRVDDQPVMPEAEAVARELAEPLILFHVLHTRTTHEVGEGRPDAAEAYADEALRCARAAEDDWATAMAAHASANAARTPVELRERVDRAEPLLRAVGNVYYVADLLVSAVYRALCHGSDRDALDFASRATPLTRELDSPYLWMILRGNFAMAALLTGDIDAAAEAFREELALCRELVVLPFMYEGLIGLAAVATARNELPRAARLLGAAAAHRYGLHEDPVDARLRMSFFEPARTGCPDDTWAAALHEGAALSFHDAIACALDEPRA